MTFDKEKWIKIGLMAVGGFVVAPFIFTAITGLVGLVVAGVVGLGIIALAPWMVTKLKNMGLILLKKEASINPIETMHNVYITRSAALNAFGDGIQAFHARIENFRAQLQTLEKKYPARAVAFAEQLSRMVALKDSRYEQYKRAKEDLARFKDTIEEANAVWEMTKTANALNAAAGIQLDPLEEIKSKTALESVQLSMNDSFAQLERLMIESKDERQIIDITPRVEQLVSR